MTNLNYSLHFANQLTLAGLPSPTFEYKFHHKRQWRFDLCWIDEKIAVEIDGGIWTQGRHLTAQGFIKDLEKLNEATYLGYSVYRFSTEQIQNTQAKRFMIKVFDSLLVDHLQSA